MKLFDNFADLHKRADREDKHTLDERAAIYEFDGGLTREEAEERSARNFLQKQQERFSRRIERT